MSSNGLVIRFSVYFIVNPAALEVVSQSHEIL